MTLSGLARHLFTTYGRYRMDHLARRNCRHALIVNELRELCRTSGGLLTMQEIGYSLEGRAINEISCGSGRTRILLWTQMHGDETTATLATMDVLNFLVHRSEHEPWVREMLGQIRLCAVPMLNPDGAERMQRRTAAEIDLNRDARVTATPEAKLLWRVHRRFRPAVGFNLHDQELSTVGNSKAVTAIALLAPATDEKRTTPRSRLRAMRIAATMSRSLSQFIEGHIAGYDDTFEPRAFGDNLQGDGTSTVLVESGHWQNDPEKHFVRKLNYVALLSAFRAVGNGSYQDVDLDHYLHLKPNGKNAYDIIVRDVVAEHPNGWSHNIDIGLSCESIHNRNSPPLVVTVKDLGDLNTHTAVETIQGHGRKVPVESVAMERVVALNDLLKELQLYHQSVWDPQNA